MKKSKVLIPAMALLLFSTAASVTSTVAWFTSTRVYNTSVSQFKVAKIDGNLECTMNGLIGATATEDENHKPIMELATGTGDNKYLTYLGDASLDYVSTRPVLWTDNPAGDGYSQLEELGFSSGAFSGTESKWLAYTDSVSTTKVKYYYAAMWTMEFKYTFATIAGTANVFFDYNHSTLAYLNSATMADPGKDSMRGFRLAFLAPNATSPSESAAKRLIWSPYDDGMKRDFSGMSSTNETEVEVWNVTSDPNAYKYVATDSTLGQNTAAFVNSGNKAFITGETAYARADDTTPNQNTRMDYLAGITKGEGNVGSVKITCIAWFEGTNSNIEDRTTMNAFKADLQFYAAMGPAA